MAASGVQKTTSELLEFWRSIRRLLGTIVWQGTMNSSHMILTASQYQRMCTKQISQQLFPWLMSNTHELSIIRTFSHYPILRKEGLNFSCRTLDSTLSGVVDFVWRTVLPFSLWSSCRIFSRSVLAHLAAKLLQPVNKNSYSLKLPSSSSDDSAANPLKYAAHLVCSHFSITACVGRRERDKDLQHTKLNDRAQ